MKTKSILLASATAMSALFVPSIVYAQSLTLDPPAVRLPVDENGVVLTTGGIVAPSSSVAIGGANGLSHRRQRVDNGWRHDWMLSIARDMGGEFGDTFIVQIGGSAREFIYTGNNTYTGILGESGTLTYDGAGFTYTDSRGVIYRFDKAPVQNGESYYEAVEAVGTSITQPNGAVTTLHYRGDSYPKDGVVQFVTRLQSVTNGFGYQLKYSYAVNGSPTATSVDDWYEISRVTAINNAEEYCDLVADACTLAGNWPFLAYSKTTVGNTTEESVTDILGREARFKTDGAARLLAVKRPGEAEYGMEIGYNADNRVDWVAMQGNYTRYYQWTENGSVMTAKSSDVPFSSPSMDRGRTVVSDMSKGVILSDTNALSQTTSYEYDTEGRVTKITAPEGNRVEFERDGRGRVTATKRFGKAGEGPIVASATYPVIVDAARQTCANAVTCDKPLTTTDALGNVTLYSYDQNHGGLVRVQAPAPDATSVRPTVDYGYALKQARYLGSGGTLIDGPQVALLSGVFRCRNSVTCYGTANERRTELQYPSSGAHNLAPQFVTTLSGDRLIRHSAGYTYDHLGNIEAIDGPLAGSEDTVFLVYNAAGQQVGTISPDPDGAGAKPRLAQRTTFNADGQPLIVQSGTVTGTSAAALDAISVDQQTTRGYDAFGRLVRQSHVDRSGIEISRTDYSYDYAGRRDCVAQRMDPATWSNAANACVQSSAANTDRITKTYYDQADQVKEIWSGVGSPLQQQAAEFAYTANGQVAWVEDARDSRTVYSYDAFDRSVAIAYPDPATPHLASTTDSETLAYGVAGRITSFTNRANETFTFGYDNLGRLTSKIVPSSSIGVQPAFTRDVYYTYNLFGELTSARFDSATGAEGVFFAHDLLGRNTGETTTMGGITRTVGKSYDGGGRLSVLTHPDGEGFRYGYDGLSRLSTISKDLTAETLFQVGYYDNGRPIQFFRTFNAPRTNFSFDAAGREAVRSLTTYVDPAIDVDLRYSYNAAGQAVTEEVSNPAHQWDGHPLVDTQANYTPNALNQYASIDGLTQQYDANGNLTLARAVGPGGTVEEHRFYYDPENRMVQKNVDGVVAATMHYDPLGRMWKVQDGQYVPRTLHYTGDALIGEYDAAGVMSARHVHGLSAGDDPLVSFGGSSTAMTNARFLYRDRLGSIRMRTDQNGNDVRIVSYDEFGVHGSTVPERFGYTGQTWVPEVGLYYYKARMYSPTLGRFMQTDPIGYADGLNMYAYVGNDPVNFVDPGGLRKCEPDEIPSDVNANIIIVCGDKKSDLPDPGIPAWAFNSPSVTVGGPLAPGESSIIVVTGRKPKPQRGEPHRYDISVVTQCSADSAFGAVRGAGNSAPGAPYARSGTHDLTLAPLGDPITQTVSPGSRTITNVTRAGHRFHPGTVQIRVNDLGGGYSSINITGTGSGDDPTFNNLVGGLIFGGMAHSVADYCAAKNGTPNLKR